MINEEKHRAILEALILNPACAGTDGYITITHGGDLLRLKPIKKKKNEKEQ